MPDVFERFATAFPLVSDESARWSKEKDVLLGLACKAGEGQRRVLDLACGNGFHARHLAVDGCSVTGVELSPTSIAVGRKMAGGDQVDWVQGDISSVELPKQFDLVLFIGNTLSLFDDEHALTRVFETAVRHLVEGGLLLVHTLDYQFLTRNPVHISRTGVVDGDTASFDKRITASCEGAVIDVAVTIGDDKAEDTQQLTEWTPARLVELAGSSGLRSVAVENTIDPTSYVSGSRKDIRICFRKET